MHPATLAAAAFLIVLSGLAGAWLGRRTPARTSAADTQCEERLRELTQQVATLRHDLRGILSPAMLVADRLLDNPDPGVKRAGEMVVRMVERMTARLAETKTAQEAGGTSAP